jgi:hypothetical protein
MTNSIILEWWIFNHDPMHWVNLAKEYKLNLIITDNHLTIVSEKE